jgi:ABC-2 type transport system permease protein
MTATTLHEPVAHAGVPSPVALGLRRIRIELKVFFRDRNSAVWNFMLPVLLLVIFGAVFGNQDLGPGVTFAQYFVAGMIASGVVYTSFQNLGIAIPMERDDGTLKRLQGVPMPKVSYFIGKIGLVFTAYVAQVTLLVIVGVLFYKLHLPTDPAKWFTFVWASVLGLIACTLCGIAFSVVPKNGKGASAVVSPIVLVLQFTSGVFFVFSQLPHWMQVFASFFPLKWLTQAMRSVFLPDSAAANEVAGSWELGRCAAMLLVWCVLGLVLSLVFFRWNKRGQN